MRKRRFQFHLKGLMVVVAVVAACMLLLRPAPEPNTPIIEVYGNAAMRLDGSVEVHDGAVRVGEDSQQTEIRASRIVVKKDGRTEVFGPGMILQGVR
jgi:hypothetical protein